MTPQANAIHANGPRGQQGPTGPQGVVGANGGGIGWSTGPSSVQLTIPGNSVTLGGTSTMTVSVAGVAGSGDTVRCDAGGAAMISATLSAAAVAGTRATGTGSVAVPAGTEVTCYIDSGAATRPILNVNLEYTTQ